MQSTATIVVATAARNITVANNTLFAFLPMTNDTPTTIGTDTCDHTFIIVRSFPSSIAGKSCIVFNSNIVARANTTSYVNIHVGETTAAFVGVLDATPIRPVAPLHRALEDLYVALYEHGFLQLDDVAYVQAWLMDLARIGAYVPKPPSQGLRGQRADRDRSHH